MVDQAYQRKEIARALFQEMEKRAKALGAKRMDLMVWGFNEGARNLYESLGIKPQRYIYEMEI